MFFDKDREAADVAQMETGGDPEIATPADESVQGRATPTREELEAFTFDSREVLLAQLAEFGITEEALTREDETDEHSKPRWYYKIADNALTEALPNTDGQIGKFTDDAIDIILERLQQRNA